MVSEPLTRRRNTARRAFPGAPSMERRSWRAQHRSGQGDLLCARPGCARSFAAMAFDPRLIDDLARRAGRPPSAEGMLGAAPRPGAELQGACCRPGSRKLDLVTRAGIRRPGGGPAPHPREARSARSAPRDAGRRPEALASRRQQLLRAPPVGGQGWHATVSEPCAARHGRAARARRSRSSAAACRASRSSACPKPWCERARIACAPRSSTAASRLPDGRITVNLVARRSAQGRRSLRPADRARHPARVRAAAGAAATSCELYGELSLER